MLRRNSVNFAIFLLTIDLIIVYFGLALSAFLRTSDWAPFKALTKLNVPIWLYFAIPLIWGVVFVLHSTYDPKKVMRYVNEVTTLAFAHLTASFFLAGLLYLSQRELSRGYYVTFVVITAIFLFGWRFALRVGMRYLKWPFKKQKTIIIGAGEAGRKLATFMTENADDRVELIGFLDDKVSETTCGKPILGTISNLKETINTHQIDDVVVALPLKAYERVQEIVLELKNNSVHLRVIPDFFSLALYRARVQEFGGVPLINLREPALNNVQRLTKRILDIIGSSILLFLLSPIMLIVAMAIKIDSKGAVFFKQTRIGENGRHFKMMKFRSMVENADKLQADVNQVLEDGTIIHKTKDDPRVTKVGRFIRRTSLDELPQLINVLRGEMSLVGPRPELPWLVEDYEPWQRVRFAVPQGITGWWQINGRSDKPLHLNTNEDLYYIQNYSIWMDIMILIKTPLVVIRGKGAY